jgi:hypothetical protein
MKFYALAECELHGMVIDPPPLSRQAWDHLSLSVEFEEVFKDVQHNMSPVEMMLIHDPQFSPRCGGLLSHASATPSEGDQQEDDTSEGELSHDNPSLI